MEIKKKSILVLLGLFGILAALYVYAAQVSQPQGPDSISVLNSGRYQEKNTSVTIVAEAGNVTELLINDTRSTESWQGYYGNISGTITLDDASNYTLYSWSAASPTGEIYATNISTGIAWATVKCLNFNGASSSDTISYQTMNESSLENDYSINSTDNDGFSETFTQTYTCGGGEAACFKIGQLTVPNATCHMVTTYVDEAAQTASFKEVLLTDNVTSGLIFAALLEDNDDGFKGGVDAHDFQMLVAENGHPGFETTTTNYYFYIELA